jgi:hypothetical protein
MIALTAALLGELSILLSLVFLAAFSYVGFINQQGEN